MAGKVVTETTWQGGGVGVEVARLSKSLLFLREELELQARGYGVTPRRRGWEGNLIPHETPIFEG